MEEGLGRLGEARVVLSPLSLDLQALAKKQRREAAKKRDVDMVSWDIVEQSTNWNTIMSPQKPKRRMIQLQVEEVTSSVDEYPKTNKPRRDFPKLDLLAPINIPLSYPASEVLRLGSSGIPIAPPNPRLAHPPSPPVHASSQLSLPVPAFVARTPDEAHASQLQAACYSKPVALIQGLPAAVGMDLALYSSRTLAETAPEQRVEVRAQRHMPPDENLDPETGEESWFCRSARSHMTIREFAHYQATASLADSDSKLFKRPAGPSQGMKTEGEPYPEIKFGTNIDLSDPKVWGRQLEEIRKLPSFLSLHSPMNILSHLGHEVLGMNTVQLYMKVPGCRTPGHQENLNLASVNVNIGPGDCVWVVTANEYWGQLHHLCRRNGVDYLKGSWWPSVGELEKANIPYYYFLQKPGDIVWIGPGAVHWVQAVGYCVNIAWNTGVLSGFQLDLSLARYEWNKHCKYKSIVPLVCLAWRLAENVLNQKGSVLNDAKLWIKIRELLAKSLHRQAMEVALLKELTKTAQEHPWQSGDPAPYCKRCDEEVFNILLVAPDEAGDNWVFCFHCALKRDPDLESFSALQQFPLQDLAAIADRFAERHAAFLASSSLQ